MKTLKRYYRDLGLDSFIFGILSLTAIVVSVISFVGIVPITSDRLSSLLIGSVGLLMSSVVALTVKRKNEITEIKNAIGMSESEIIHSTREMEKCFASSAWQAKRFILDTSLNRILPDSMPIRYFSGVEDDYRRAIYERVKNGEISFKRVEIIFHRQGLEWAVFRLLLHEHHNNYLIRHYEPSSKPIPMLSFLSFDNSAFYLGGFQLGGHPTEESALVIKESNLADT